VHCDVTAVFPWLTHAAAVAEEEPPQAYRLVEKLDAALDFLDDDVKKRRQRPARHHRVGPSEVKSSG